MTEKFILKSVCGEDKIFKKEDSFPMTEKQIVNELNTNEKIIGELMEENKELKQRIERLEDYKEASIKFGKEVEDFFERHEFDTVNFNLIDIVFDDFEFYADQYDELKKQNKELQKENEQLKQENKKIFDYINKQSRINHDELKLWKKSNNKARKEKQVLIREANIMCLYNLLRDLTERVE